MAIITISRGSMSGGQALAKCVASQLGIPCLAREVLLEAAQAIGVSETVLSEKIEKSPGLWDRLTLERRLFVTALQANLAEQILKGELVYHGRAGHLLLRGLPAVLRVRLEAPLAMRITAVIEQQGLDAAAAARFIERVDQERARWTRAVYGADIRDAQLYDLVVNLEVLSLASACHVVVQAARQEEFLATDAVRRKYAEFALACRVKLALATAPASRSLDLEVSAEAGIVTVRGTVPEALVAGQRSRSLALEIEALIRRVDGVAGIELRLEPEIRTFG